MRHATLMDPASAGAIRAPAVRGSSTAETESFGQLGARATARLVWGFIALGVAARLVRYLLKFPLWEDESFLCANLLDRGYAELTRSLDYGQVAPILYLWVQRSMVELFGFHEYSLRAFSLVCGLASLFLFRHVAARLFSGWPLVLSVGVFAVAYPMLRYSAEAKPYGSDMLVGLAMLALVVEWLGDGRTRWLWGLAIMSPVALGLSLPAVFAAGGASVAVGFALLTSRFLKSGEEGTQPRRRGWAPWIALNLAVAGTFLVILRISVANQTPEAIEFMQSFWKGSFPPKEIGRLPGWLLEMHTGEMVAYPAGSRRGGSSFAFVGILAGLAALARIRFAGSESWTRAKRHALLLAACIPPALNLLAAALGRYPYGGQTRLSMYHGAMFCLLIGLGWAMVLSVRLPRFLVWSRWRPGGVAARQAFAVLLLAVLGSGLLLRDFVKPTKSWCDVRARDFARNFWFEMPHRAEVVCVHTDLGEMFSPRIRDHLSWIASYLCNQKIYSPRHARGEPADLSRVSWDRPLVCVMYSTQDPPVEKPRVDAWLASMCQRYDLAGHERFPATRYGRQEQMLFCTDYVELYRFVPKGTPPASSGPASEALELTTRPDPGLRE